MTLYHLVATPDGAPLDPQLERLPHLTLPYAVDRPHPSRPIDTILYHVPAAPQTDAAGTGFGIHTLRRNNENALSVTDNSQAVRQWFVVQRGDKPDRDASVQIYRDHNLVAAPRAWLEAHSSVLARDVGETYDVHREVIAQMASEWFASENPLVDEDSQTTLIRTDTVALANRYLFRRALFNLDPATFPNTRVLDPVPGTTETAEHRWALATWTDSPRAAGKRVPDLSAYATRASPERRQGLTEGRAARGLGRYREKVMSAEIKPVRCDPLLREIDTFFAGQGRRRLLITPAWQGPGDVAVSVGTNVQGAVLSPSANKMISQSWLHLAQARLAEYHLILTPNVAMILHKPTTDDPFDIRLSHLIERGAGMLARDDPTITTLACALVALPLMSLENWAARDLDLIQRGNQQAAGQGNPRGLPPPVAGPGRAPGPSAHPDRTAAPLPGANVPPGLQTRKSSGPLLPKANPDPGPRSSREEMSEDPLSPTRPIARLEMLDASKQVALCRRAVSASGGQRPSPDAGLNVPASGSHAVLQLPPGLQLDAFTMGTFSTAYLSPAKGALEVGDQIGKGRRFTTFAGRLHLPDEHVGYSVPHTHNVQPAPMRNFSPETGGGSSTTADSDVDFDADANVSVSSSSAGPVLTTSTPASTPASPPIDVAVKILRDRRERQAEDDIASDDEDDVDDVGMSADKVHARDVAAAHTEAQLYAGPLRKLQGIAVPHFYGIYRAVLPSPSGGPPEETLVLLLERLSVPAIRLDSPAFLDSDPDPDMGAHDSAWETARMSDLPRSAKIAIVKLYLLLHRCGVVHGDTTLRHVLQATGTADDDDDDFYRFRLVDFDSARWDTSGSGSQGPLVRMEQAGVAGLLGVDGAVWDRF